MTKAGEQPTITQAIRDSLMTFWAAGAHAARHNKEAPPQAFDREAARLVALIDTRTTSLAAQDELAFYARELLVQCDEIARVQGWPNNMQRDNLRKAIADMGCN